MIPIQARKIASLQVSSRATGAALSAGWIFGFRVLCCIRGFGLQTCQLLQCRPINLWTLCYNTVAPRVTAPICYCVDSLLPARYFENTLQLHCPTSRRDIARHAMEAMQSVHESRFRCPSPRRLPAFKHADGISTVGFTGVARSYMLVCVKLGVRHKGWKANCSGSWLICDTLACLVQPACLSGTACSLLICDTLARLVPN